MKIMIEKGKLKIRYAPEDWERLKSYYEKAGLEVSRTTSPLGQSLDEAISFYRLPYRGSRYEGEFRKMITEKLSTIDDVNRPLITWRDASMVFNVAIFRIIPQTVDSKGLEFEVPIGDAFIPKEYLKFVGKAMKEYLEYITSLSLRLRYVFEIEIKEAKNDEAH